MPSKAGPGAAQMPAARTIIAFDVLGDKGEGTFSKVITARCKNGSVAMLTNEDISGRLVAVKRMKNVFSSWEQVEKLREVQCLKRLNPHPNVIQLLGVNFDVASKRLDIVCELMEMNIYEKIKNRKQPLDGNLVMLYIYQLCKALDHMHRNGIFHRDVKPENILIRDNTLKLADFGSCRGIYSKPPFTEYISTRWYRPPECLLSDGLYNYKMDMWSSGCVFFEILTLFPLFPGKDEKDQMVQIHNVLGTPKVETLMKLQKVNDPKQLRYTFPEQKGTGLRHHLPHATDSCIDLMMWLLMYDPDQRITARQAVKHPYFRSIREGDKKVRRNPLENARTQVGMARERSNATAATSGNKQQSTEVVLGNESHRAAPQSQARHASYGAQTQQKRSKGGNRGGVVSYGSQPQAQMSYGAQQKMPALNLQKKKQSVGRRGGNQQSLALLQARQQKRAGQAAAAYNPQLSVGGFSSYGKGSTYGKKKQQVQKRAPVKKAPTDQMLPPITVYKTHRGESKGLGAPKTQLPSIAPK